MSTNNNELYYKELRAEILRSFNELNKYFCNPTQ